MSAAPRDWVALQSAGLAAAIDPLGAQLSSLRDGGARDLLWDGDPAVWKGRAPLLFPIVGELAGGCYRLGSRSYSLPRHGFARGRRFEQVRGTDSVAEFRLAADRDSLAVYPFQFVLTVQFALADSTLTVLSTMRNEGEEPMPASFGYHPAFRWPLPYGHPRSEHDIEFERDEPAPIRRLDANGLLTPAPHATPIRNGRLRLRDSLFAHDALIFDQVRSRSVQYGADGGPRLQLSFPDTPYLGVWTKPGANFICIEPWHGLADPQGFTGDLGSKPGICLIPPGGAKTLVMSVTRLPDPPID